MKNVGPQNEDFIGDLEGQASTLLKENMVFDWLISEYPLL